MIWTCFTQQLDLPDAFVAEPGIWYSDEPVQGLGRLAAFVVDGAPVVCAVGEMAPSIRITKGGVDIIFRRSSGLYAGYAWFTSGGDGNVFFHSVARDVWIYGKGRGGLPVEPSLFTDGSGALVGDDWYEAPGALLSPRDTSSVALTPRGPNAASAGAASYGIHWPRWERSGSDHSGAAVAGFYSATGGQSGGSLALGVPTWHGSGGIFAQSFRLMANGDFVADDGSTANESSSLRFNGPLSGYGLDEAPEIRQPVAVVEIETGATAGVLSWDGLAVNAVTERAPRLCVAEVSGWLW